ncbi:uncharacterized protein N7484_008937 [Penicillium longicatenatum]|uniref:uncharacterized protein n=1 Tax=Penicillium longicatenatum TaxID=1561947 RepID=UPI0025478CED|nr:uncharacterized protein N7484_008937 [Penicillium longicatenatum]KAJ5635624.1 hypothetical protein N7484_008937 [Penicillium longicatenatum]
MSNRRPTNDVPGSQGSPARDERRQQASSAGTPSLGGSNSSGTSSGTSSASLGREPHEITHYRSLVNKLLDFIATGDEESVARVISTIRTGASHDQILEQIAQYSADSGSANGNTNGARPGRS